jgi:malate dehydrogenase (oxaloacetate-decarboxylating)
MLMAASETLAKHSPLVNNGEGPVLPELKDIQTVRARSPLRSVNRSGTGRGGENLRRSAAAGDRDNFWQPEYRNYRRTSI